MSKDEENDISTYKIKKRYFNPLKKAVGTFVGSMHEVAEEDRAEMKEKATKTAVKVKRRYVNPMKSAASTFAENVTVPYEDNSPEAQQPDIVEGILQKPLFWIWMVCFFLTVVMFLFMNNRPPYGFDLSFSHFLQGTLTAPIYTTIAKVFSFVFDDLAYIAIVVAITLAIFVSKKNKRFAVIVLVGGGLWGLTWLIKRVINRPRPTPDLVNVIEVNTSGSFPSGHVVAACLLLGALCFVLYLVTHKKILTSIAVLLSSVIVIAVTLSRIYLGAHWLTDCIGGILFAFSLYVPFIYLANLYLKAFDKITNKFKKKG